jgi:hypothetical protein
VVINADNKMVHGFFFFFFFFFFVPNVYDSMLRYQTKEPAMHFETTPLPLAQPTGTQTTKSR